MAITSELQTFAEGLGLDMSERRGRYRLEKVIAERKAFLSKKKLRYIAEARLDDAAKQLHFTERLEESGAGLTSGDSGVSPGFGFKVEKFSSGAGGRSGSIAEQSQLFGKNYQYSFDYGQVRKGLEQLAANSGYAFTYHVVGLG